MLCRCDHCISGTVDDPTSPTGRRAGKLVSRRIFERHQREQADKARAAEQAIQGSILSATLSQNQDATTYSLPTRASDFHEGPQVLANPNRTPSPKLLPADLVRINKELDQLQSTLDLRIAHFGTKKSALVFELPPSSIHDPVPPSVLEHPKNMIYKRYSEWLWNTSDAIFALQERGGVGRNKDASVAGRCLGIKKQIQKEFDALEDIKLQGWREEIVKAGLRDPVLSTAQKAQVVSPVLVNTDHLFQPLRRLPTQAFMQALLFMIIGLHVLSAVSRVDVEAILATARVAVFGAVAYHHFNPNPTHVSSIQAELLSQIPKSLATTLDRFEISPQITEYACCPTCFAIYAPTNGDPANPVYPEFCTWKELPSQEAPCGTALVISTGAGTTQKPHRVYGYQDPISWLARFLSRDPKMEAHLERSWTPTANGEVKDIFDADVLQNFKGPDGKTPWSICPNDELHLVFSLFVDWFNPYGNKQAGKSNSIGAIYMVCLSLPAAIRYKPENVYLVSIIPGPKEPTVTQLNHLLQPIVADFLKLWHSGARFSRTAAKRYGRTVKCAIVPVICDLPALRKTAGFAGHAAKNFCSFCRVKKAEIADDFNIEHWSRRGWTEHIQASEQWRRAHTQSERDKIFDRHGLRWSVLLDLPYWDPTRFAVVDSMHNLFLGEFQHHCRRVWGVEIKAGKKKNIPHSPERQYEELAKGIRAIAKGSTSGLLKLRKGYIIALAKVNGIEVEGTSLRRRDYADALVNWYSANKGSEIKAPPVMAQAASEFVLEDDEEDDFSSPDISTFSVLGYDLLQQIQSDIRATLLPSWMEYAPRNFGSPSHGKLKADQWRTVCCVNLIITLIRIWGIPSASAREKAWLENYTDMVTAVNWVTRRSTSDHRIAIFASHMKRYLVSLKDLFGERVIVPNHHLSLHLIECLRSFGPVHSWWTFPFERYNGMLRHLKTNNKPGEIEKTFLRYFPMGANLRAMMADMKWPDEPEYVHMQNKFFTAFDNGSRGTLVNDILSWGSVVEVPSIDGTKVTTLDDDSYRLFLQRMNADRGIPFVYWNSAVSPNPPLSNRVEDIKTFKISGISFSTFAFSKRDCNILFRSPGSPTSSSPSTSAPIISSQTASTGRIDRIFLHSHRSDDGKQVIEPYLEVKEYQNLSEAERVHDPFSRFPLLEVKLCHNKFARTHIIKASDVISHFAALVYTPEDIGHECIVALSLDRS